MDKTNNAFINHFSYIYDHFIDIYNKYNEEQSNFNAKFAHEIKNPLAIIRSMLQLVEKKVPEVSSTQYWSAIFDEIDYVNNILNNMSNYRRSTEIKKQETNLVKVLNEVITSYSSCATQQNKHFSLEIMSDLPIINADNIKLKQVFSNLIKNAFEATNSGDKITVHAKTKEDNVIIEIKDTGIGINEDDINTIFEPFKTFKTEGTGLGLSIVKNIVKEHGGSISVKSQLNKGTVFKVKLPIS
ncbi:MAG: sensor histidine kinase [Eubacteriales bacterium]